jgi:hypothetical protein
VYEHRRQVYCSTVFSIARADHEDTLEREVLTYRAFRDRRVLRAWEQRRRVYERTGGIQTEEEDRVVSALTWIRNMVLAYRESARAVRDG